MIYNFVFCIFLFFCNFVFGSHLRNLTGNGKNIFYEFLAEKSLCDFDMHTRRLGSRGERVLGFWAAWYSEAGCQVPMEIIQKPNNFMPQNSYRSLRGQHYILIIEIFHYKCYVSFCFVRNLHERTKYLLVNGVQ